MSDRFLTNTCIADSPLLTCNHVMPTFNYPKEKPLENIVAKGESAGNLSHAEIVVCKSFQFGPV